MNPLFVPSQVPYATRPRSGLIEELDERAVEVVPFADVWSTIGYWRILTLGFTLALSITFGIARPVMAENASNVVPQIKVPSSAWRKGASVRATVEFKGNASHGAAWSSDSERVAGICAFGNGFVIDAVSGRRLASLPAPQSSASATAILFTPDDKHILMSGRILGKPDDQAIAMTLLDATSGAVEREIEGLAPRDASKGALQNLPQTIAFDPVRSEVVIKPLRGLLALEAYNPTTWNVVARPLNVNASDTFALRPYSLDVAFYSGGLIFILDRVTGIELGRFQAMPADIQTIAYSPDGLLLLTGMLELGNGRNGMPIKSIADANRHRVVGWRADGYARAGAIDVDLPSVYAIAFHPDGGLFAIGTYTGVVLFDSTTFAEIVHIKTPATRVAVLAFSPDGGALAVGGGQALSVVEPR